jgi:hypothetical protein
MLTERDFQAAIYPRLDLEISEADRDAGVDHWIRTCNYWYVQCREAWALRDDLINENARLQRELLAVTGRAADVTAWQPLRVRAPGMLGVTEDDR